jgi:hypothetical protein
LIRHKLFIGAEADLIRNIHGIAKVAELDGANWDSSWAEWRRYRVSRGFETN